MYLNDKRKIRLHMKEAGFLLNHLNLTIKMPTLLDGHFDVGISLSFQAVTSQVFSAPLSLTSVFGMGTGGPSASLTPTV